MHIADSVTSERIGRVVTGCVCLRISEEVWLSPGSPRGYHMTCMNAMKSKLVLYDVNTILYKTVYTEAAALSALGKPPWHALRGPRGPRARQCFEWPTLGCDRESRGACIAFAIAGIRMSAIARIPETRSGAGSRRARRKVGSRHRDTRNRGRAH